MHVIFSYFQCPGKHLFFSQHHYIRLACWLRDLPVYELTAVFALGFLSLEAQSTWPFLHNCFKWNAGSLTFPQTWSFSTSPQALLLFTWMQWCCTILKFSSHRNGDMQVEIPTNWSIAQPTAVITNVTPLEITIFLVAKCYSSSSTNFPLECSQPPEQVLENDQPKAPIRQD